MELMRTFGRNSRERGENLVNDDYSRQYEALMVPLSQDKGAQVHPQNQGAATQGGIDASGSPSRWTLEEAGGGLDGNSSSHGESLENLLIVRGLSNGN